jgi:hypothetical protein
MFIGKTYHLVNGAPVHDIIPDKYDFYYNSRWASNLSNTKRIAIRKIKAFPMTFVFEVTIGYVDNVLLPINMITFYSSFPPGLGFRFFFINQDSLRIFNLQPYPKIRIYLFDLI